MIYNFPLKVRGVGVGVGDNNTDLHLSSARYDSLSSVSLINTF